MLNLNKVSKLPTLLILMNNTNLVVHLCSRTMNGGPPPLQGHGEPILEMGQQHLQHQQQHHQQHKQQQQQHEQQQQQQQQPLGLSQAASWVDEPHTAEIRTMSR